MLIDDDNRRLISQLRRTMSELAAPLRRALSHARRDLRQRPHRPQHLRGRISKQANRVVALTEITADALSRIEPADIPTGEELRACGIMATPE